MKRTAVLIALYATISIATFGRAATTMTNTCRMVPAVTIDGMAPPDTCPRDIIVVGAILGGIAWPLYWSWEIQS